ncbi:MAG: hypothetical protein LC114_14650 [Bryobacterales bacterium]|nr:hypothetical protein [Bryobacterales bacterium]
MSDDAVETRESRTARNDIRVRPNYILVDYENVQPDQIDCLRAPHVRLLLFVGAQQTKLSVDLYLAMQEMGERSRLIRCGASGSNALDFYIAFYCGEILAKDSDAFLHIISRDKGFDPLIAHLNERNKREDSGHRKFAQRVESFDRIPLLKSAQAKSLSERVSVVIDHFRKGSTKPRSLKTLATTVHSIFHKTLTEPEVNGIINELQKRKLVVEEGTKLVYKLDET